MRNSATILILFFAFGAMAQATMDDLKVQQSNETILVTWGQDHDWSQIEVWASSGHGTNKLLASAPVKGGIGRYAIIKKGLRRSQETINEVVTIYVTRSRHGVIFRDSYTLQLYYSALVKLRTAG